MLLAVGGCGAVLAEVVAIEQGLRDTGAGLAEGKGVVGHLGDGFEDDGVVGGLVRCASPDERGVAVDETGGDGERVDFLLSESGGRWRVRSHGHSGRRWLRREGRCARDGAVEVVGVGGAEGRDGEAGLSEAGGELGVSVDDGADGGELPVEEGVGVEVGGGLERAVDDVAVEIGDDHVVGAELVVVDAGGLDDDETLLAVDAAGVAEGVEDEAALDQFEIGVEDGGAELLEQHGRASFRFHEVCFLESSGYLRSGETGRRDFA